MYTARPLGRRTNRFSLTQSKEPLFFWVCAHSGVINTLRHIRRLTENRPIHTIIGGMHLIGASSRQIKRTIKELKQIGVSTTGTRTLHGNVGYGRLMEGVSGPMPDLSGRDPIRV